MKTVCMTARLFDRALNACPRLFGLQGRPLYPQHLWMVNVSVMLFVLSVALSVDDMYYSCSGDLRSRIVPARAMLAGLDPYFFEWEPGMGERLADCYQIPTLMTRATVLPSVLWAYTGLAKLPFGVSRWGHFCLEEAAFLILAILMSRLRRHRTDRERALAASLMLVAVGCSPIWRLHVERGQYYIYVALLLGLALFWLDRYKPMWAGALIAWAAFLRPTIAVVFLPFLAKRRGAVLLGGVAGMAVAFGLSLPLTGLEVYRSAKRSIAGWDVVFGQQYLSDSVDAYLAPPALRCDRALTPRVIEGVVTSWSLWKPPLCQSYSLLGVSNTLIFRANQLGANLRIDPKSDWRLRVFRGCCAVLLLVLFLVMLRLRRQTAGLVLLMLGLFLAFLADYMTAPSRNLYSEVFQVLPFGVLGPLLFSGRLGRLYRWCGAVGVLWAPLSYLAKLAPGAVHRWLIVFSWLGPYSALVFFGGAVLYLARQDVQAAPAAERELT